MQERSSTLHVQRSGKGTPFIWCHGLLSSIDAEDAQAWLGWEQLPAGIELIRYDARGHGASAPAADAAGYAWPSLAADLLAVADRCGAGRFIAGGASMGCATALCAALQAPQRVRALVLLVPPTIWEGRTRQRKLYQRGALLGALLGGRSMGKLVAHETGRALPAWMDIQGDRAALALGMGAMSRKTIADLFHGAALSDLPPREAFGALAAIPALIIGWTGDATHPEASARALHALLPASTLFIAGDAAGMRAIPARIREFLEANTATA